MTTQNLSFLPAPVAAAIQDGILERLFLDSLKPLLKWRGMCDQVRHGGGIGESVTKTRPGLIQPDTEESATVRPGQDPGTATRSLEQFTYQLKTLGKSLPSHLPSSFVAAGNLVQNDVQTLGVHAAQTLSLVCRNRLHRAYGSGRTWATATQGGGGSTSLAVQDTNGFETRWKDGKFVAVSPSNPLAITIGSTSANVVGCDTTNKVLTLDGAKTWTQYDAVTSFDAPYVVLPASRATTRAIQSTDKPTAAMMRAAKARLTRWCAPGLDGRYENTTHVCFISPDVKNALFEDVELHDAIKAQGLTGMFATGAVGDYAGIRFVETNEFELLDTSGSRVVTPVHTSVMMAMGACIEAFTPEIDLVSPGNTVQAPMGNYVRINADPSGALALVIRGPQDALGRNITSSWVSNVDYTIPTDHLSLQGNARYKRACLIYSAGPA